MMPRESSFGRRLGEKADGSFEREKVKTLPVELMPTVLREVKEQVHACGNHFSRGIIMSDTR